MPAENFFHAFYNNAPTVGKTWDWHAVLLDIQKMVTMQSTAIKMLRIGENNSGIRCSGIRCSVRAVDNVSQTNELVVWT